MRTTTRACCTVELQHVKLTPCPSCFSLTKMAALVALAAATSVACAGAREVTVSNLALPVDTSGDLLRTGELSVLRVNETWYLYMNDWGGCPGVDCCPSEHGCASCCFNPPSSKYPDACVYTANHSVVVYSTTDFQSWTYGGVALPMSGRRAGVEFRPQVVLNNAGQYVMWYEDRWSGGKSNPGYAVAVSPTPAGPFLTLSDSVATAGAGRIGDYDVFVDPADGACYHVRTGITVVKLTPNCTSGTGEVAELPNGGVEGPAMFTRNGVYYILVGVGCCACKGGSNVVVYMAPSPMGPYTYGGDVGSNTTAPFDAHSPYNYVTRAQGSKVIPVPAADGSVQYVWIGNQWTTSTLPGAPRDHDLLYWTVLGFNATGHVQQIVRADTTTISLP